MIQGSAGLEESLRMAALLTAAPPAYLIGLETAGQLMREEKVRDFLGHALLDEVLPALPGEKAEKENAAIRLCGQLEGSQAPLMLRGVLSGGVSKWADYVLPLAEDCCREKGVAPDCLCFGLSALIMLWTGPLPQDAPDEDGDVIRAFRSLSCDMPPETLSYAVLSDQALWGRDLRDIPFLEDKITGQLRDLQLIGLFSAMEKAWKKEGN